MHTLRRVLSELSFEDQMHLINSNSRFSNWRNQHALNPRTAINEIYPNLFFKDETVSIAGTFKIRGASFVCKNIIDNSLREVVVASTGNHALSMASMLNGRSTKLRVFLPATTAAPKIEAISTLGAEITLVGNNLTETIQVAQDYSINAGVPYIGSADPHLAFGHSTLLLEALKNQPTIKRMYFPVGIGAGIAGQIFTASLIKPDLEIIGVIHKNANTWIESLVNQQPTICKSEISYAPGLRIERPIENVFRYVSKGIADLVPIDDNDLMAAADFTKTKFSPDMTSLCAMAAYLKWGNPTIRTLVPRC